MWTGRLEFLRMAEVARRIERQEETNVELSMILSRRYVVEWDVTMNSRKGVEM
jgi:hypothetical protein